MPIRQTYDLGAIDVHGRSVAILASTPNAVDGEALATWDLTRFLKNPVILWAHDGTCMPIGRAEDVKATPAGLEMRVVFATAAANPFAEQVWNAVQEKIVRAVSVGFEPGAATTNADGTVTRTANNLLEVSFVPVPADEDAGVEGMREEPAVDRPLPGGERPGHVEGDDGSSGPSGEGDEAARKAAASEAGRALANHRHGTKLDANFVMRMDGGRLERCEATSFGGRRIAARICRTGVLEYRNPDGSIRRELRLPEEVFHPDSIASLRSVPVIDIRDHTKIHSPETFRKVALGHTENARHDGESYVEADLVIQDADALERIDEGDLKDVSCGYVCRNEAKPGIWKGQPYDVVQRDIRYNHVALCPPNRGRAGPTVGLRLDVDSSEVPSWCLMEIDMTKIRLDGKDYEVGSKEHLDKLDEMRLADAAAVVKATKERDEAQARYDAAKAEMSKAEAKAAEEKAAREKADEEKEKALKSRFRAKWRLFRTLTRLFGKDDGDGDEKDEEKMDALLDASDRDVMLAAIQKVSPEFKADGKSDDYVAARFDAIVEELDKKSGVDGVVIAAENANRIVARNDAKELDDIVGAAEAKNKAARLNAWKTEGAK